MNKKLSIILSGLLSATVIAGAAPMTALAANTGSAAPASASDFIKNDRSKYTADGVIPLTADDVDESHLITSASDYYKKLNAENGGKQDLAPTASNLPSKWDNSTNENAKYIPAIRNQTELGACCAWASVYYQFTYTTNKARGVATTDANTYSPNFTYNFVNKGENVGTPLIGNYSVLMYQGTPNIQDLPLRLLETPATNYSSWNATGDIWEKATHNRMIDYDVFFGGSITTLKGNFWLAPIDTNHTISDPKDPQLDALKSSIRNGEMITFCSPIFGWNMTRIKNVNDGSNVNPLGYTVDNSPAGNYTTAFIDNDESYHQMNIVGYNDEIWTDINTNGKVDKGEMGAFKIVNSWGPTWGNGGYMWLAYDALNEVSSVAGAPAAENRQNVMISVSRMTVSGNSDDSSNIYLKYTLNSNNRQAVRVSVTATPKNSSYGTSQVVSPYNAQRSYDTYKYDYNFNGTEGYGDGTMYFDLNNVVSNINSNNLKDYTWEVIVTDSKADGAKLTVKEMKIVDKKAGKEYNMDHAANFTLDGKTEIVNIPITDDIPVPENAVTIYYKGYANPNIHYQVGNGSWTAVPGVKMTATNEVSGYTHKYTIDLGNASYANVCFNDGNNNWDSRNGANYTFNKGSYTFSNGTIKEYSKPVPQELSLNINTSDSTVPSGGDFTVNATAQGGTAPYQYRYTYSANGGVETQVRNYCTNTSVLYSIPQNGYYTIKVSVMDATGKVVEKTTNVTVASVTLYGISSSIASPKTGDTIKFSGSAYTNGIKLTYKYTVTGNGTTQTLTTNSDNTANWTPSAEGTYNAKLELLFGGKTIVYSTMTVNVQKAVVTENTTTIYYKGYSNPYIHFRTANGTWTSVPGIRMTATNEVSGYTHKYTISLGTASYAEVCFNDGNNNWDSRNGSNYIFNKGTYTFSNGTIKTYSNPVPQDLSLNLSLSDTYVPAGGNFSINASAQGGTAPYQYQFSYSGSYETNLQSFASTSSINCSIPVNGTYTVKAIVKDATGKTVTKTATVNIVPVSINSLTLSNTSPKVGDKVTLTANVTSNNAKVTYRYSVVSSTGALTTLTTNSNNTATWTPTAEGTYTARVELYFGSKPLGSKGVSVTVQKGNVSVNATTIYYKGYSNPNIHYQVGDGSWTEVPGVKMIATNEVSGYTHKYTINLGNASDVNVCFNDGNNNWDSRNGANYRFNKGTYTYSNGTMIKLSDNPSANAPAEVAKFMNLSTLSASKITLGSAVKVYADAAGGSGDYTYSVSYKKSTSDTWTQIKKYSSTTTAAIKPASTGSYDICIKAKDSKGNVVTKKYTVKVVNKLSNKSTVSAESITKGQTVTVNCASAGGIGSCTYSVSYKKASASTWTVKQNFTSNANVTIKPASAATYDICVKVKDSAGTIVKKYFTVTVK